MPREPVLIKQVTGATIWMEGDCTWHNRNSRSETHDVGLEFPNSWILYDMSGNIWEWCQDWFDENYYSRSPSIDPVGPSYGRALVIRSGSWYNYPKRVRSSLHFGFRLDEANCYIGFRIVRNWNINLLTFNGISARADGALGWLVFLNKQELLLRKWPRKRANI